MHQIEIISAAVSWLIIIHSVFVSLDWGTFASVHVQCSEDKRSKPHPINTQKMAFDKILIILSLKRLHS